MNRRNEWSCSGVLAFAFTYCMLACGGASELPAGSTTTEASAQPMAAQGMGPRAATAAAAPDSGMPSPPPRSDAAVPSAPGGVSPELTRCLQEHHIELMPLPSLRAVARTIAQVEARCAPTEDEQTRIASEIGRGL